MNHENVFKVSMGISLLIHGMILFSLSRLTNQQLTKSLEKIEVTYYKLQLLSEQLQLRPAGAKPPEMKSSKDNVSLLKKDRLPSTPLAKGPSPFYKRSEAEQRKPLTVRQFASQKKITVPPVKSEKMKNPVYNNYYQIVREKIKHRAYNNYSRYETGEVYLTFVVLSSGVLKEVRLVEEKSRAAEYLKETALKSISDAAPFPAFPANLQFPELSFNVVISFEVGN